MIGGRATFDTGRLRGLLDLHLRAPRRAHTWFQLHVMTLWYRGPFQLRLCPPSPLSHTDRGVEGGAQSMACGPMMWSRQRKKVVVGFAAFFHSCICLPLKMDPDRPLGWRPPLPQEPPVPPDPQPPAVADSTGEGADPEDGSRASADAGPRTHKRVRRESGASPTLGACVPPVPQPFPFFPAPGPRGLPHPMGPYAGLLPLPLGPLPFPMFPDGFPMFGLGPPGWGLGLFGPRHAAVAAGPGSPAPRPLALPLPVPNPLFMATGLGLRGGLRGGAGPPGLVPVALSVPPARLLCHFCGQLCPDQDALIAHELGHADEGDGDGEDDDEAAWLSRATGKPPTLAQLTQAPHKLSPSNRRVPRVTAPCPLPEALTQSPPSPPPTASTTTRALGWRSKPASPGAGKVGAAVAGSGRPRFSHWQSGGTSTKLRCR